MNTTFAKNANGILVSVSVMIISFINALASPLLVEIATELNIDVATAGYLPTVTTLFMGISLLAATKPLVTFGLKRTMAAAMVLVFLGNLSTYWGNSFFVLLLGRALVGIGMGTMGTGFSTIAATWFHGKGRSTFVMLYTLGNSLAAYLCFIFSLPLYHQMGDSWRACYLLTGVIAGILAIIWMMLGKDAPHPTASSRRYHAFRDVLFSGSVWVLTIYHSLATLCTNIITNYLPAYLQTVRAFSAEQSANWSGLISLAGMAGSFVGGTISTSFDKRRPILISGAVLSLLSMAGLLVSKQPWIIFLCIILFGFGARFRIPATTTVSTELREDDPEFAAGAYAIMYGVGSVIGIFAPSLLSWTTGLIGMERAMLCFTACLAIAVLFSLFVHETGSLRTKS